MRRGSRFLSAIRASKAAAVGSATNKAVKAGGSSRGTFFASAIQSLQGGRDEELDELKKQNEFLGNLDRRDRNRRGVVVGA